MMEELLVMDQADDCVGRSDTLTDSAEVTDMEEKEELRIVLLGKTGVGKSSVGNTILGENKFTCKSSLDCQTQICERAERVINGRRIVLIDTPGIFDPDRSEKDLKKEIISSLVECAPGPHVFILVLPVERHTEENQQAVKKLLEYFTGDAVNHMVLLFTHGDDLDENVKIHEYINNSRKQYLKDLVERCGNRVHVIDNKHWNENSIDSGVLARLKQLNLSDQAIKELTNKMALNQDNTPWFNVLPEQFYNIEPECQDDRTKDDEKGESRSIKFQLIQLMKSIKSILRESKGQHYSNESLDAVEEAINVEVENILKEMGSEGERVDLMEVKKRARERVRTGLQRHVVGVTVGILLGALTGVGVGVAAPVVLVAGLIRTGWRKNIGPAAVVATVLGGAAAVGVATGLGATAGVGAGLIGLAGMGGVSGYKEAKTADNSEEAADKAYEAVKQKAGDMLKTCWNLGKTETAYRPLNKSD